MMTPNPQSTVLRHALAVCLAFSPALHADSFIFNPSFELNFHDTWPHYGPIEGWINTGGGPGTNKAAGPFNNDGTRVPDGVQIGFVQGGAKLAQAIEGLEPGQSYWIQFFYDSRQGGNLAIDVLWDDEVIDHIPDIMPTSRPNDRDYRFRNVLFTPQSSGGELAFRSTVVGDSTMLLDAITIVKATESQVIVRNPSFEASGTPLDEGFLSAVAGWGGEGSGRGGVNAAGGAFANNGTIPDQDHVGFIEGPLRVGQMLRGIVEGETYAVSFRYNAPNDNAPELWVTVDDVEYFSKTVAPVGGAAPYHTGTFNFTAAGATAMLVFEQPEAGQVVLLDDIKVTGVVVEPIPNVAIGPKNIEMREGDQSSVSVTVSGRRLERTGSSVILRSSNESVMQLVGADVDGTLTLDFPQGSDPTTLTAEIEGIGQGRATIVVQDNGGHEGVDGTVTVDVISALVLNPSFEASAMQPPVGYGPIVAWTTPPAGSGVNTKGPYFFDNGNAPDRRQVAFIQGDTTAKTLSQMISGLVDGQRYALQFFYNRRTYNGEAGSATINFAVKMDGQELASFEDVQPVGEGADFHFCNAPFVASSESALLEFVAIATGDASLLLDAVTIVPQSATEIVVKNPSFEASGLTEGVGYSSPIAGWVNVGGVGTNGDGQGPFTDNGLSEDQARVAFIQGPASLSQTVEGLTPGTAYTLSFLVNARQGDTSGGTPYQVIVDGEILLDTIQEPVGTGMPYQLETHSFTATSEFAEITFKGLATGAVDDDQSLLLDNIRITPDGVAPPQATIPLTITSVGGNAVNLSWPTSAPATWRVQYSTSLLINSWRPLDAVPSVSGGSYNVLDAIDGPVKFYRLYQP